jgi:serine/threonine protein kinase
LAEKKMIENGTLLQNRYLIEKQIGAGGMGAVYLATDQRFDSLVAIKETFYVDDEFGEAFEREAKLLNSLVHPVLPHVSDYFTENDGYFLVMQFIEGEDLSEILKREGAFSVEDVLRWTDLLLDALDYLHSQEPPIIHRDIKPHNLKLTARGDIFLLDFGLAKLKSEDTTGAISVFGYSRTYSPLEQIQGTGTDARSDIFALGATVYHLLTGKPPADAVCSAAAFVNGKNDPLRSADEINSEIPDSVANVLNSALALNPERRFASAKAMRQALENALKTNSSESAKIAPEKAFIAAAPVAAVINSAETENFPALEAFAAESGDTTPIINDSDKSSEILTTSIETPAPEAIPNSTAVVEAATKIAPPRLNQSRIGFAALAAILLIFGSLAAFYFVADTDSPPNANQSSAASEISNADAANQTATISDAPTPETSSEPVSEIVSRAKAKSPAVESIVEKQQPDDLPPVEIEKDAVEKPKTTLPKIETPSSAAPRTARRRDSQTENETRPRVVESVPDIESIFTGQIGEETQNRAQRRREDRRRRIEQMTDEERRELRRERRQRRNQPSFPF